MQEPLHGGTADLRRWFHQFRYAVWCKRYTSFMWPPTDQQGAHKRPQHVSTLSMDMGFRPASPIGQHQADFLAGRWRAAMRELALIDPPFPNSDAFAMWQASRQPLVAEFGEDQVYPWAILICGDDPKFLCVSTKW